MVKECSRCESVGDHLEIKTCGYCYQKVCQDCMMPFHENCDDCEVEIKLYEEDSNESRS